MLRSVLLGVAALGVLVCAIGSTGLFAALTDTARTGVNNADSAALAASADIRLATATFGGDPATVTCGTFGENLSSGLFTVTDALPDASPLDEEYFCIRNVGSQSVSLASVVDSLADIDTACTGDEAVYDTTCGADGAGELSSNLTVSYVVASCATGAGTGSDSSLSANATTPVALGSLAAGAVGCYQLRLLYPDTTSANNVQKAQSDTVTWRFKFTAQA